MNKYAFKLNLGENEKYFLDKLEDLKKFETRLLGITKVNIEIIDNKSGNVVKTIGVMRSTVQQMITNFKRSAKKYNIDISDAIDGVLVKGKEECKDILESDLETEITMKEAALYTFIIAIVILGGIFLIF